MDLLISSLLGLIIIYLIVKGRYDSRQRRKTHVLLKRCSRKSDRIDTGVKKQNWLLEKLLDILEKDQQI